MAKRRLDSLLVEKDLLESRTKAQALIMAGEVVVDGRAIIKPGIRLDEALKHHQVRWHWVKGHAGHAMNERADQLARDGLIAARAGAVGAMKSK